MQQQKTQTKPLSVVGNNAVKSIYCQQGMIELYDRKYNQVVTLGRFSNVALSKYQYENSVILDGNDVMTFKNVVKYLSRKGYKISDYSGGFIMERV